MRKLVLAAGFTALTTVATGSGPAEAGGRGWSAGHWSLPAGARFALSSPGARFHAGAFAGHPFKSGIFPGRRSKHHVWRGKNRHGPVFIIPSQPVFVVRNVHDRGFGGRSMLGVRRFDPVGRTVVVTGFDDGARILVETVAVPRFKPRRGGRWHGALGSD